jgi:hypothetical protein
MSDDYLKAIEALETVLQNDLHATDAYYKLTTAERVICAKALNALMDRWFILNHLPKS